MIRNSKSNRRFPVVAILALLSVFALTLSCSQESANPGEPPLLTGPNSQEIDEIESPAQSLRPDSHGYYANYSDTDELVTNFTIAWRTMDADEYAERVLCDGVEPAPDGEIYAPFKFYFAPGLDYWDDPMPELWQLAEEIAAVTQLMSGEQGAGGIPGVESIILNLIPLSDWEPPVDPDQVEGDPYPEGTLRRHYLAELIVDLHSDPPGDVDAFMVQHEQIFHVIPVLVTEAGGYEHLKYRLWKWRDLGGNGLVAEMTWSAIKLLYAF